MAGISTEAAPDLVCIVLAAVDDHAGQFSVVDGHWPALNELGECLISIPGNKVTPLLDEHV